MHELHSRAHSHQPTPPNTKAADEQPAGKQTAAAPPPAMSATAVAALTQLLSACLTQQAMPTLQDIMKDRQEKLESSGAAEHALSALSACRLSGPICQMCSINLTLMLKSVNTCLMGIVWFGCQAIIQVASQNAQQLKMNSSVLLCSAYKLFCSLLHGAPLAYCKHTQTNSSRQEKSSLIVTSVCSCNCR